MQLESVLINMFVNQLKRLRQFQKKLAMCSDAELYANYVYYKINIIDSYRKCAHAEDIQKQDV